MKGIIIFDGHCGLCDGSVKLLLKLDKHKVFRYSSIQGEYVKSLEIDNTLDSIVFYEEGKLYYKSTAILKILRCLGGLWILTNVFYIIPTFIRDALYDIIAKYRYQMFGKMESCRILNVEEKELFLD